MSLTSLGHSTASSSGEVAPGSPQEQSADSCQLERTTIKSHRLTSFFYLRTILQCPEWPAPTADSLFRATAERVGLPNVSDCRTCRTAERVGLPNVSDYRTCGTTERVGLPNVSNYRTCRTTKSVGLPNVSDYRTCRTAERVGLPNVSTSNMSDYRTSRTGKCRIIKIGL
ncbi:hypothetical protein J6590_073715 [Homalodisca vitripennis]|nr:hypothetical protein J6590_073715 [Homalodisca vitripennis]